MVNNLKLSSRGLLGYDTRDGGSMVLRNVGILLYHSSVTT